MKSVCIKPTRRVCGEVFPPGDKSISHRAVMFSALTNGTCRLTNMLMAEDCLSTIRVFSQLGVEITLIKEGEVIVQGKGVHGLSKPPGELYCGNSGTTMRLLSGILAAQPFSCVLTGDESLQSRPMDRVVHPLRLMGARIHGTGEKEYAPLHIEGTKLTGITYHEKKGSAQVKSCLLLAGLYAEGTTTVESTKVSRDHTERMMSLYGIPFERTTQSVSVRKITTLPAESLHVPGDISSAAFFIVAALIVPGSSVTIKEVGLNETRTGCLTVLRAMGALIDVTVDESCGEPRGTIRAQYSSLTGTTISGDIIPLLIDELPILMIAASFARGVTRIEGADELRVKETDRIKSMVAGLRAVGVAIEETPSGVIITGNGGDPIQGNVTVNSFKDHRTAMSMAIAALRATGPITIDDADCVSISYPQFFAEVERIRQ